jgi:hypothetical protein
VPEPAALLAGLSLTAFQPNVEPAVLAQAVGQVVPIRSIVQWLASHARQLRVLSHRDSAFQNSRIVVANKYCTELALYQHLTTTARSRPDGRHVRGPQPAQRACCIHAHRLEAGGRPWRALGGRTSCHQDSSDADRARQRTLKPADYIGMSSRTSSIRAIAWWRSTDGKSSMNMVRPSSAAR